MSHSKRIFLVDDHDVVRAGMKAVLHDSFDIVGEAGDVNSAVSGILDTEPEMVVLDVKLPGGGGAEVIRQVHKAKPDIKFMALTVSSSRDDVVMMMQAGVDGYITKTTMSDELPSLIDQTVEGQRPVSPDVAGFLLDIDEDISAESTIERLTPREREVVNLIARGYSYRETAARLSISVKTLENHMGHIFDKLSVASRHELAALVYEEGLVDTSDG